MRLRHLSPALGLLACSLLVPAGAGAQAPRIAFEPRVTGLPDGALWSRSTVSYRIPMEGNFQGDFPAGTIAARTTRVERRSAALVGGRVVMASGGGRWRVALAGSTGSTTLEAVSTESMETYGSFATSKSLTTRPERQPARLTDFGVHVERVARWRGLALVAGAGAMGQQVRARTTVWNVYSPSGSLQPTNHHRTFLDPAMRLSGAMGPADGPLAGLRIGLGSTHVWRGEGLANMYRAGAIDRLDEKGRRMQWQPELAIGWELPVLGRASR